MAAKPRARPPERHELEPIERASIDELRALQIERLRTTLRHVYAHVPRYREKFAAVGVHPDDFRELADLARFPFTSKEDLRETYPFGMFAVPREQVVRVHASSGTTGKPTIVGYTAKDLDTWASLCARSIRASGGRPGDVVHIAYGYGLFTGGLGVHYGAERLGCTVVPVSGGMTERQVQLICDLSPRVILVTPSYMLAIADEFDRQGIDPRCSSLAIGIHGAEPWTEPMRREIEDRFAIDAVDIYGLSEVIGPGVANECLETKDGPHVWEDHFYPEIVDPLTGEARVDGEPGELVFTSLTKEALPVVRYRTRDLSRLLPGTARSFRRIARIHARTDDMVIIRGVNVFPTQVEEIVLEDPALSGHFFLEVTRPKALDELRIVVEARPGSGALEREESGRVLAGKVKSRIGVSTDVEVRSEGGVERSLGKARRVYDRRAP
jgi:phenylacetate-CoA ligase